MRLHFDDFELDIEALELTQGGEPTGLKPMAVRVLLCLVEREGELIRREEVYEALWPDGFVDRERLLNTYVRQIRSALGERAGDDRYIRTYPRRGYRFLAPVQTVAPPAARSEARAWSFDSRVAGVLAASLAAVLVGISLVFGGGAGRTQDVVNVSLAVGREILARPAPADRASAVHHFRAAIEASPDLVAGHVGLAEALYWAGDLEGARAAAEAALGLDRSEPRALLVMGSAALSLDWAWEEAEAFLRSAVREAPDDPDLGVALAYLLVTAGRRVEALDVLDRTARQEPASASITGDLGTLYGWLGAHRHALDLCERTVAVAPEASWGHRCALRAAHALGRTEEVRARATSLLLLAGVEPSSILSEAADVDDDVRAIHRVELERASHSSHFSRAVAFAGLGRDDEALEALRTAVAGRESGAVAIGAHPAFHRMAGTPEYEALRAEVLGPIRPAAAALGA